MPFGAIGGLISGIGSIFGGISASNAASQQAAAANKAIQLQEMEYMDIAQKLAPFLNTGTNALQVLGELFGITTKPGETASGAFNLPISSVVGPAPSPNAPGASFTASPGYQYQLQQQQNAIQNSAAGRTGAVSGNMMRALQSNAQGLAGQDYWNWYNAQTQNYQTRYGDEQNRRNMILSILSNLTSGGQAAAAQQGQFGQQAVQGISNNLNLAGSARAAGTLGMSNAFTNLFSNPGVNNSLNYLFGGNNPNSVIPGTGDITNAQWDAAFAGW